MVVNAPVVNMSANCSAVSTHLMDPEVSKLIVQTLNPDQHGGFVTRSQTWVSFLYHYASGRLAVRLDMNCLECWMVASKTQTPHNCNAGIPPCPNLRQNIFLIRNCSETWLFVSCTSKTFEHMFVIQLRMKLHLTFFFESSKSTAKDPS